MSISFSEVSLMRTKKGRQTAPHRCLAGEITCWVSQWETTEEKETKKTYTEQKQDLGDKEENKLSWSEIKGKREQEESLSIKKTTKIFRKKPEWHIGRRRHLFAWGAVLPTPPLQEVGKEGEESTAHHITKSHTMGNPLPGWCAQWEALQVALHFPSLTSEKQH